MFSIVTEVTSGPIRPDCNDQDNIYFWANRYFSTFVVNASLHTQRAKKLDLEKFLSYFSATIPQFRIRIALLNENIRLL